MKRKYLNVLFIIILTAIVLFFALKDDYQEITHLLWNANISFLFLGFLLAIGYCFFKALIVNNIITQFKPFPVWKSIQLQLMTFFFNAITPFATGGQPFQVYSLKKYGIDIAHGTNVIVQESILHQCAMILLTLIALLVNYFLNICEINPFLLTLFLISFLVNALVLFLLFTLAYGRKLDQFLILHTVNLLSKLKLVKNKVKTTEKWQASIDQFHEGSKTLLQDKKRFIGLLITNMIGLITLYIVPLVILFSLGNYTSFDGITAIILTIFISMISSFVPLPGGTGGQEYLFILLFGLYVGNPLLNSLMILWRFVTYYLPMITGAIVFNFQKKEI